MKYIILVMLLLVMPIGISYAETYTIDIVGNSSDTCLGFQATGTDIDPDGFVWAWLIGPEEHNNGQEYYGGSNIAKSLKATGIHTSQNQYCSSPTLNPGIYYWVISNINGDIPTPDSIIAQSSNFIVLEKTVEEPVIEEVIEPEPTTPTTSITLEDSATGKMANIIGDNFGEGKEIIITVTDPEGTVIQELIQQTTSEGRINVMFLLDETPITGTYVIHLTNHSFETTLEIALEGDTVEVIDTVTIGDPTEILSPSTTQSTNTSTTSSTLTNTLLTDNTLSGTEKEIIKAVLRSVIDLLQGLILAIG